MAHHWKSFQTTAKNLEKTGSRAIQKAQHRTAAYHPQCNAQAEVCNKTIAKYLNSFEDKTTLDWEQYLAPMAFSYNTSLHRSIQATPYFLTYCQDARLPSFPNLDIQ